MKTDFFAGVEYNGELYFSDWCKNALFKMNNAGEIEYISSFEKEETSLNLHTRAYNHRDIIYFIPALGQNIAVLNLRDMSISYISIPKKKCGLDVPKFVDIIPDENGLWMVPIGYDALVWLDFASGLITEYDNWPEGVEWNDDRTMQFAAGVRVNNNICMLPRQCEYFVTFDISRKEMKKWDWNYPEFSFSDMLCHEGIMWLLPRSEYPYIIKYNIEEKREEKIVTNEEVKKDFDRYSVAIIAKEKIVRAPYQSNEWFIIDTKTNEIIKKQVKNQDGMVVEDNSLIQNISFYKNGVIATSGIRGVGEYMSAELDEVVLMPLETTYKGTHDYIKSEILRGKGTAFDEGSDCFKEYIDVLVELDNDKSIIDRKNVGQIIYDKVKE